MMYGCHSCDSVKSKFSTAALRGIELSPVVESLNLDLFINNLGHGTRLFWPGAEGGRGLYLGTYCQDVTSLTLVEYLIQ